MKLITTILITSLIALGVAVIVGFMQVKSRQAPSCTTAKHTDYGPWLSSYDIKYPFKSDGVTITSHYITMRDGVKIAVDVYRPTRAVNENMKLPTILHGTRYFRSSRVRFPFTLLLGKVFNPRRNKIVDPLVHAGYTFVSFDVRGTGASGGVRKYDLDVDEIDDIKDIIDWVLKQKWTNGRLGAWGISYEGMITEAILSHSHPNLLAAAPFFAPFDIYRDVIHINGIFSSAFFDTYGSMIGKFERDDTFTHKASFLTYFYFHHMTSGAALVSDSEDDVKYYEQSQLEHKQNWRIENELKLCKYSDTPVPYLNNDTVDSRSMQQLESIVKNERVGILGLSSWYDGAFVQSTITRFLSVSTRNKKLILGPWNHGGEASVSPFSDTSRVCFHFPSELIAFFDYHLKGEDNEYYSASSPVKYFTIGEEKWHDAQEWPPIAQLTKLYLSADNKLLSTLPTEDAWKDYNVDFNVSTDKLSRWNLILQMQPNSLQYKGLKESNIQRLSFISEPLQQDMEITGHPSVKLSFKANNVDSVIFVYLMDRDDTNDTVTYITEGHLRAVHRTETEHPLIKSIQPFRTFSESDTVPLVPNEQVSMNIFMMPISYQVKKGHRLLFAISGSDIDNFDLSDFHDQLATEISIHLKESHINIPMKPSTS